MAEPILWANKAAAMRRRVAKRWNPATEQMETLIDDETGEPMIEKVPQRGHPGDPMSYMRSDLQPLRMQRWWHVLKHCGNETRVVTTNAAAQADPDTKYKQFIHAKGNYFGWIPVGTCPVLMRITGDIRANQLAAESLKVGSEACAHGSFSEDRPCPHYYAERDARIARHNRKQGKRDRQFAPDAEKALVAQKQQTTEIAQAVGAAVSTAMSRGKGK